MCGQWRLSTRLQKRSHSHCQTTRIPARSSPRSKPPIPLNSDPTRSCRPSAGELELGATSRTGRVVGLQVAILERVLQLVRALVDLLLGRAVDARLLGASQAA